MSRRPDAAWVIETGALDAQVCAKRCATWPEGRRDQVAQAIDTVLELGAQPVLRGEPDYPAQLLDLASPPAGLWRLGATDHPADCVGIVGSRAAPPSVLRRVEAHVAELSADRRRVVSGAAVGVDRAAHRGAVGFGSIAVVPFGLEEAVAGQARLPVASIVDGGGTVWCAALARNNARGRYVARNRLIAALASELLVPFAGLISGTMHTVRAARQLGRPISSWWGAEDSPANDGARAIHRWQHRPAIADDQEQLLGLLAGCDGRSAELPERTGGWHEALLMLELEGLIERLRPGRYALLKRGEQG
jgi:predicted Rossmann fold nucleotide-binding protein DprA/Smf involved in DNA uptake